MMQNLLKNKLFKYTITIISIMILISIYHFSRYQFGLPKESIEIDVPTHGKIIDTSMSLSGVNNMFVYSTSRFNDSTLYLIDINGTIIDHIEIDTKTSFVLYNDTLGIVVVPTKFLRVDYRRPGIESDENRNYGYNYEVINNKLIFKGKLEFDYIPENSSNELKTKYYCFSIDIETGSCFLSFDILTINKKHIFPNKAVNGIELGSEYIVIESRSYTRKSTERQLNVNLYITKTY